LKAKPATVFPEIVYMSFCRWFPDGNSAAWKKTTRL